MIRASNPKSLGAGQWRRSPLTSMFPRTLVRKERGWPHHGLSLPWRQHEINVHLSVLISPSSRYAPPWRGSFILRGIANSKLHGDRQLFHQQAPNTGFSVASGSQLMRRRGPTRLWFPRPRRGPWCFVRHSSRRRDRLPSPAWRPLIRIRCVKGARIACDEFLLAGKFTTSDHHSSICSRHRPVIAPHCHRLLRRTSLRRRP